jgi:hypothetical protein
MGSINVFPKRFWPATHTATSKYLLSRLAQLVDEDEVITYRYPATNGLILLEELYTTATYCLERWKTRHRLKSLLLESVDPDVPNSIANDPIILKYFRPALTDISRLTQDELTESVARKVQRQSLIHLATVRPLYLERLRAELEALDFRGGAFDRCTDQAERLLLSLVPQLLRNGYSLGYLQLIPRRMSHWELSNPIERIFAFLEGGPKTYDCFVAGTLAPPLATQLSSQPTSFTIPDFWKPPEQLEGHIFRVTGNDPFSALLSAVVKAFRQLNLRNPDVDAGILAPIWDNGYFLSNSKYDRYDFASNSDPTVPIVRPNTFRQTLVELTDNVDDLVAQSPPQLEEPIYFYNLSRNVPSIENSFLLLWTSLESLMGMKTDKADIELIQDNLAPAIALGAVGRRVNATVQRLRATGKANRWTYLGPSASEYHTPGLCEWTSWLVDQSTRNTADDPFAVLEEDPLLCKQYRRINEKWRRLEDLARILRASEKTTRFQLDRLYMTRNRIIHSGRFEAGGTYQWIHLEWYVGKILAQAVLITDQLGLREVPDPRDVLFASVQGQYRSSLDYFERHADKPIESAHLIASAVMRFPAFCY